MDRTVGDTFYTSFTTRAFATGIPTVLAGSPVISIYEDASTAAITAGVTLGVDHDAVVGLNLITILSASTNGYEAGKDYQLVITTGTVGGVSVVGEVVGQFSLGLSAAFQRIGAAGAGLTAINLPNQTMDITGNLSGSVGSVTAQVTANMTAISGDTPAADNLELMYDGTGYTADTAPASRAQVGSIGASSGGALSFAIEHDNQIEDTIDNAAAVDKGDGTVGIPVTGHAFTVAGQEVTIAGSINYNNSYTVESQTTDEVVITETYAAETFTGSETIVTTIKTIANVGTPTNTFSSVEAEDGVYHIIVNDGDNIDWVYQADVGGGRTCSEIIIKGFLNTNNDTMNVQLYDFVGADWETRIVLQGQNGSANVTTTIAALQKHTGSSGVDLGKVFIRFVDATAAGHTLNIDEMLVEAVSVGQTVGYANGAIWVDTIDGVAGSEPFVHGTADTKKCLLWSDALLLSTATGIKDFHILNGSAIALTANSENYSLVGDHWTLALGGQACSGIYIQGATVSGIGTSSSDEMHFEGCDIGTASIQRGHFDKCGFDGTLTQTLASDYNYHNCYSKGNIPPIFTKTAGQTIISEFQNYAGDITTSGLESGDIIELGGFFRTIVLNGADAIVHVHGHYQTITNNITGADNLDITGAIQTDDVAAILALTGTTGVELSANAVDDILDEVNTGAAHNVVNSMGRQIRELRQTNVYDGGRIWIDTVNGAAGSTNYENGTVDNPVDNIADAVTLSASLGINRFEIAPGTSLTLASAFTNYVFNGESWTLATGGQALAGSLFHGATVSGIFTGADPEFEHCMINNITASPSHFRESNLGGTITVGSAGDFFFDHCHSAIAGTGAPIFDFVAAVGSTGLNMRHYSGGIDIRNMGQTGTDLASVEGFGQIILNVNCTGGTLVYRGAFDLTDNSVTVTINADDNTANILVILEDTADMQPKLGTPAADISADIAAVKVDTAAIVIDTNELQGDWTDTGRLDTILDAILDDTGTSGVVLTAAERNSIADAMLDRDMSTGADSGSTTVRTIRQALRANRNKVTISGGTMTVYKEDDVTASWTAAITTTAGDPISDLNPAGP